MSKIAMMALAVLCTAFSAQAEGWSRDSLGVYSVDEVVIRATRLDIPFESLVSPIDVVSGEEVSVSNANSATDAVGDLPGVFVERTGDFGRADISIRGLGSNGRRVTVLMDGHPVKMGLYGCTITHSLPVSNVQQIELIRAPGSVLYGSDALGGVLNIVTAEPALDFALRTNSAYGSYSTWKFNMLHSARVGRAGYLVSLDHRQSDGHLPNSAYRGNDFLAKVTARSGRSRFSLLAKYFDGYKEEPATATEPPGTVSDVWNDYKRGAVDFEMSSRFGGGESTLKLYDEFGEHKFSDGWHSRDQSRGIMAYQTRFVGESAVINVGADYRQQLGDRLGPDPGSWDKYEVGVYGLAQLFIREVAVATAGLRIHRDEISGTYPAPHFGLAYDVGESTTLRASVSGGFRSPQISELYLFPSSNTELSAERIWSYEAGITHRFASKARISASLYRIIGKDFIELVSRKGPGGGFTYANVGEIDFRGLETSLTLNPHPDFESRISYAYLDPGERTTGRPGNKVDFRGTLNINRYTLLAGFQYVGDYYAADNHEERIGDYLVINARLSRALWRGFDGFVSFENITDENYDVYTEIPGGKSGLYRMPGRRFLVGFNYKLGG
jgi:outer membrane cobalamin receptor